MKAFLRQVAAHYAARGELRSLCFVFPNRRSTAFFRRHLALELSQAGGTPALAPGMVTISDFFARACRVRVTDRINLLVELYACYSKLYPGAESLDEFIYWGDVLLGDFNDIDKYLVDPAQIFTNVADLKAMQDDYSYLTESQRRAILSFVGHFREGKVTAPIPGRKDAKEAFRQIWNILLPLYRDFGRALEQKGRAYEGMVYRSLAGKVSAGNVGELLSEAFPHARKFVFVGLNALNECEKKVLRAMQAAGIAEFCWDWSGSMMKDPLNKASLFMAENVREFPQALTLDAEGLGVPQVNVVSVPSSTGQVKLVGGLVEGWKPDDCAVMLPDESLLLPLLGSIPPQIEDINVTMGYPMVSSEFYAFMHDVLRMQLHSRCRGGRWSFYHKYVWNIFSNGIFRRILGDDPAAHERMDSIRKAARYYIDAADLLEGLPPEIFRCWGETAGPEAPAGAQVDAMCEGLREAVSYAGARLDGEYALEVDFAKEYYTTVGRLGAMHLDIRPATFVHLLESALAAVSVPFNGEPLRGLQVMGPLETRALDFRNVIILSSNEGVFPRRSVSSSFIPPELRKGFGLPTYEYQDAVWAYYFYRLIARAEKVWMLYDSRTEGLKSGEESRYIKQLRYHFRLPIAFHVAQSAMDMPQAAPMEIVKSEEDIEAIRGRSLSPSALLSYIECPAKFYYHTVKRLGRAEEVSESLDSGMIGSVFHDTMHALFFGPEEMLDLTPPSQKWPGGMPDRGQEKVTLEYLREWLTREDDIRSKVLSLICDQLRTDEVAGRDLVAAGVIVKYVTRTIGKDIELLEKSGADGFTVEGLELRMSRSLHGFRFFGIADRVDRIGGGRLRLVDYKTGRDDPAVLDVPDEGAEAAVAAIFDASDSRHGECKAGLQFYVYDRMLSQIRQTALEGIDNAMYSTSRIMSGETPRVIPVGGRFADLMDARLEALLGEIVDPEVPFTRTEDTGACGKCDFKMLCGR